MPAKRHTHTYGKWKIRKSADGTVSEQWFKCLDPHCTHIAPRSLVVGKASVCAHCGTHEVIMNWKQFRLAKAICVYCSNSKEAMETKEGLKKAQRLMDATSLLTVAMDGES